MELGEHLPALLLLLELPENRSGAQALLVRVGFARVFEQSLHCVDLLGSIL